MLLYIKIITLEGALTAQFKGPVEGVLLMVNVYKRVVITCNFRIGDSRSGDV